MDFALSILEQGLIYGILALGIYITYKILDFPDLTVDGSFPLGSAVTAALLTKGVNPYLSLLISFLAGVLAGTCTGLIHVKGKVRDLLSGIIMMTALYTVNLVIAGSNNVPLFAQETIFSNSFLEGITGGNIPDYTVYALTPCKKGDVYSSPAVSATFDRLLVQLEDVSPFVERIAVYQYCGMLSKPGSTAATDHPSAERLYKDYRRWLDAQHWL